MSTAAVEGTSLSTIAGEVSPRADWCTPIDVATSSFNVNLTTATRIPGRPTAAHQGRVGQAAALLQGRTEEGVLASIQTRRRLAGPQGGLYRPEKRSNRRAADRSAVQARHIPVRRPENGPSRCEGGGIRGRYTGASRHSPSTARPTTMACSTPTRQKSCDAVGRGSSPGCLTLGRGRIIGDYRRVALYGVARLIEVKKEERAQINDMWPTDEVIRTREELAEQIRALKDLAEMGSFTAATSRGRRSMRGRPYSGPISPISARSRKRMAPPCRSGASRPSSTSTSSGPEGRQRSTRPAPRSLGSARPEAAHRPLPANAGIRCAVQRRSLLGDRMRRRNRPERSFAGHQEQLPDAAHADQSRAGAGTEHHGAVVEGLARQFQALLRQGQQGDVVASI